MPLSIIIATATIEAASPYTQSRRYEVPSLEGESKEDYDKRNWRLHQHVRRVPGREHPTVHIPARALQEAIVSAAQYSKKQIPGQGKATWTAKFRSGIAILEDVDLGLDPEQTDFIDIWAHADGKKGSGSRVPRRFPIIANFGKISFDVQIMDPIITKPVFSEMLEIAGLFIGIGQYRPEKGGTSGRFRVVKIDWLADRQPVVPRAA